ncbi:MAG: FG-GAP repeat protein, partial [Planctomycetes bacterium]|nr:FG-GAP repeat protein [Planctomycetota bacterium]
MVVGSVPSAGFGGAFVYEQSGTTWTQTAILVGPNGAPATLGHGVAIGADFIAVGDISAEKVHVFEKVAGTWTLKASLAPSGPTVWPLFGFYVAASGDRIVASGGYLSIGAGVFVFRRIGSSWVQEGKLQPTDPQSAAEFGQALAVDGTTAVVGARLGVGGPTSVGAVYVFDFDGAVWKQTAKLVYPSSANWVGRSVDIDGDRIAVGAEQRALIYRRFAGLWLLNADIASPGTNVGQFGGAVAIDGQTLAVAARADLTPLQQVGSITVYDLGGSAPIPRMKLTGKPGPYESFGESIDLRSGIL